MSKLEFDKILPEHLEMTRDAFNMRLYEDYIVPRPKCHKCEKEIATLDDLLVLNCRCPIYYHDICWRERNVMNCEECGVKVICKDFFIKFLTYEMYREIYERSIADSFDRSYHMKVYRFWFVDREVNEIYPPPLIRLHDYLEPHDPKKTMSLLYKLLENHTIVSFDEAIKVTYNDDDDGDLAYNMDKIDYCGKKVFVGMDEFRKRFEEFSYGLIGDDFVYSDNVCVVGGAVHKCLESRIKLDDIPEYCDIDIFVCNSDESVIKKETRRVIKYFRDKLEDEVYWVVRGNIINMFVAGYSRSIQIILFRNRMDYIISKFDFSHIQYLYDGEKIMTTLAGLDYSKYLVSVHNDGYYDMHFPKRYFKAKMMKLCLALPTDKMLTLNLPRVMKIDYWYPSYTDDLEKVKQQIKSLYGIHKRYVTKGKPYQIQWRRNVPVKFKNDTLCHHTMVFDNDSMENEIYY